MKFRVELETRAEREYRSLSRDVRERIAEAIDRLAEDPRPSGAKKLVGAGGYRIRRGDYRILYTVDNKGCLVRVYRIGHRRDVYRDL